MRVAANPRRIENHFLADLVAGRESDFPVLARAVGHVRPASNPKIEWLIGLPSEPPESGSGTYPVTAEWNYTEIFRTRNADKAEGLTELLAKIEFAFRRGTRDCSSYIRTCGGHFEILGRDLLDEDLLSLRILRDARLCQPWRNPSEDSTWDASDDYEWLAEVSLQVVPG